MVDHSNRIIAYYNGAPGSTKDTIDYAAAKGIEVVTNNPVYKPREKRRKLMESEKILQIWGWSWFSGNRNMLR